MDVFNVENARNTERKRERKRKDYFYAVFLRSV